MKKKAWVYENGEKKVLEYTPSGKLSKLGKLRRKYPNGLIEIHNMRAVMR